MIFLMRLLLYITDFVNINDMIIDKDVNGYDIINIIINFDI